MKRALRYLAYASIAFAAIVAGALFWLLETQHGAQFAFGKLRQLIGAATTIEGVEGSLGGTLRIGRFEIVKPGLVVRIEGLEAEISPAYTGRLVVRRLHARSVEVRTAPAAQPSPPSAAPPAFAPPFAVRLDDGAVGTFTYGAIASRDGDVVLKDIVLRGEGAGARWKVSEGAATTPWGKAKLSGSIAGEAPFDLEAAAAFEAQVRGEAIHAAAKAKGTLQLIELQAEAAFAQARASASTTVRPFAPKVLGAIAIDARGVDLARFAPSMPSTRIALHARLESRGEGLAGPLRVANADPGPWDARKLPLVSATAEAAFTSRGADFESVDVALPAGTVRGTVHVGSGIAQANLHVEGVDLAALHGALKKTQLAGRLEIAGDGERQRFEVAVEDPRFALEGRASIAARRLEVETASVKAGGGIVSAKATLAFDDPRAFRVEGEARHFDPSAFSTAPKGDLNFTFSASGTLAGSPAGEASVDIAPGNYAGLAVAGRVHLAGDAHRVANAAIEIALGDARLAAKGSFGRPGDAMDVSLHAPNLAAVSKPFGAKLAGSLDAHAKVGGTFDAYAGSVALDGTNLVLPGGVRMSAFRLEAQGSRAAHRISAQATLNPKAAVSIALRGGVVPDGQGVAWSGELASLSLSGPGAFSLAAPATLRVAAGSAELGDARLRGGWGEAHLEVTRWMHGAFDAKGSAPSIEVRNLAKSLQLEEPPKSDLVFSALWDLHAADTVDGTIRVRRESGDVRVGDPELAMGLSEATLEVIVSRGRLAGTLDVAGSRVGTIHGEAHGELARSGAAWEFAKSAPVDARVNAALPSLEVLAPWLGPDTKLAGRLDADLVVTGTGADPRIEAKARARQIAYREPRSGFELADGNVSLHLDGTSLVIDELSARTPWRVPERAREALASVKVPDAGGTLSAAGSVDFSAHTGSIRLKVDKVPVTQLASRFIAVSGEARLESGAKGTTVDGSFRADGGWIGALAQAPPSPSDDIVVVRAKEQPAEARSKEPIHIDVSASLGEGIAFQGRGLDTRLAGELRVVGEIGTPLRATGSIRTVQGTYEGYGQKLTIDRGVLTFAGPIDNPKLNVLATRKGLPVEAGLEVTGTTARPRVRLVSTPDVPESEKLSWLVLGRSAQGASPTDISLLTAAAGALMGEKRPGTELQKALGIDEVSIGRSDSGSPLGVMPQSTVAGRTGAPAATDVVTIGSQLTKSLRMSYEQGFADAEGALKLSWNITRQFQLLARAGYLPGLDVVYRWTIK